jgi:hypothetical protein
MLHSFPLPVNFPLLSRSRQPLGQTRVRVVLHIGLAAVLLSSLSGGCRPHSGGPPHWHLLPLPIERKQEHETKVREAGAQAGLFFSSSSARRYLTPPRLRSRVHRCENILIWMLGTVLGPYFSHPA